MTSQSRDATPYFMRSVFSLLSRPPCSIIAYVFHSLVLRHGTADLNDEGHEFSGIDLKFYESVLERLNDLRTDVFLKFAVASGLCKSSSCV